MNVLVIAPHPDDEAIGCGGAVLKHTDAGDSVRVVVLTSGELGLKALPETEAQRVREAESEAAAKILGIEATTFLRLPDWGLCDCVEIAARALAPVISAVAPGLVYLPHPGDDHPDHRACLPILQQALRTARVPAPRLRGYEIWAPMPSWDEFEDIGAVLERKLDALHVFKSQLVQMKYDRAVVGLAQYRGALAGRCEYAEVFCLLDPVEEIRGH